MIWKAPTFGLLLCVLVDGGPAISEQKFVMHGGHQGELKHIGDKKHEHHDEYAWSYPSYEFSYKVKDPDTHDEKGQHEARHGDEVRGEYWLIEPDGRKRIVHYSAEKHSGFHAIVKYSGPLNHIRHKSKDEYKKNDEEPGKDEEEHKKGGDEENDSNENRGSEESRGDDEGRDSEDGRGDENSPGGDESRDGEKDNSGDEGHLDKEKHGGEEESKGESGDKREGVESRGHEKDDFWSFIGFGKKYDKKEWYGKKENRQDNRDGKRGGLFGYEWGRKYDNDRDREGKGSDEVRDGDKKGRGGGEKGRKDGRGNEADRGQEGGRGGEEKDRGNNKSRDREGLSSYHIPMPYPKRIENFNARAYSHGRFYRASPVQE